MSFCGAQKRNQPDGGTEVPSRGLGGAGRLVASGVVSVALLAAGAQTFPVLPLALAGEGEEAEVVEVGAPDEPDAPHAPGEPEMPDVPEGSDDPGEQQEEGQKEEHEVAWRIERVEGTDGRGEPASLASGGAYASRMRLFLAGEEGVVPNQVRLFAVPFGGDEEPPTEILPVPSGEDGESASDEGLEADGGDAGSAEGRGEDAATADEDPGVMTDDDKDAMADGDVGQHEDEQPGDEKAQWVERGFEFEVPEGRYAQLWLEARDDDGTKRCSATYCDVCVDETSPGVRVMAGLSEVEGGSLLSSGDEVWLELIEETPQLGEAGEVLASVEVRELTRDKALATGPWTWDEKTGSWHASMGDGPLPDGRYDVNVRCEDRAGNEMEPFHGTFSVDTQAPEVELVLPSQEAAGSSEDALFFDHEVEAVVRLRDAHLSGASSTILGVALDELREGGEYRIDDGSFCCSALMTDESNAGEVCLGITLREGSYDVDALVRAEDETGRTACSSLAGDHADARRIVVDMHAPTVVPSVSSSPHMVVEGESGTGSVAFFGERTSLRLDFEDAYGIAEATLDEKSLEEGWRLRLDEGHASAAIALGEEPLSTDLVVRVADHTGNTTWWSLGDSGLSRTSRGQVRRDNEPLLDPSGSLVADGHPGALIEDTSAPDVTLVGVNDGAHEEAGVEVLVRASDRYLGALALREPGRTLATVTKDGEELERIAVGYEGAAWDDETHAYRLAIPARTTHEDDGRYDVAVELEDLAGNVSRRIERSFVIDTTAPVLQVTFDDEATGNTPTNGKYFQRERTARVEVRDRFLELEDLNSSDGLVRVVAHASLGRTDVDVVMGAWEACEDGESFACGVTFPVDGSYVLEVSGQDRAGNLLEGGPQTPVDETGRYVSEAFVVDATEPRVSLTYDAPEDEPRALGGVPYYRRPVTVQVEVVDRNLDVDHATLVLSDGQTAVPRWEASEPDEHGEITYRASALYVEEGTGMGAGRKQPVVAVRDLADNGTTESGQPFVVDQTAPSVDEVSVSRDPSAHGVDPESRDPYWFYNERDGIATVIRVGFGDEYALDKAWVDDPDGVYETERPDLVGHTSGVIELALRDFVAEGAQDDTDWDRDVLLHVRDVAGNERVWSIDRSGNVMADRIVEGGNPSINDLGVFPMALVKDATAPQVSVSGVEDGAYYNEPKVAHIVVEEHNFAYLERFDPRRVVATVEAVAGDEGQAHSSWTIAVDGLKGTSPHYGTDQSLVADGHYEIVAGFEDMARNESNVVRVGAFTIDTTAPVIQVSWDNDDVRNGMYYNATRTATVTVVEHNFDPGLFEVESTGEVGSWTSDGDTHVCQVRFLDDRPGTSPHTLSVRGKDRAGNEALAFEEPPFAVDTQAPTVGVLRRASGSDAFGLEEEAAELLDASAFSRGIMPLVVCEDEANLDAGSVDVTLRGKREAADPHVLLFEHREKKGDNCLQVDWGNLGVAEGTSGPFYRMDADDVYTLSARVADLAGNVSEERSVDFSVNRYGSNYFVEPLYAQASGGEGMETLLVEPPRIVVHEINVSGAMPELEGTMTGDQHTVTKEYANATTSLVRTGADNTIGYSLVASTAASATNRYEGWTEYVYTIHEGNFGRDSSSDYGDGGQGQYRVDVSTHDRADNHNTTARYWESGASRAEEVRDKTATVTFMLDEFGPTIEELDVPPSLYVGESYDASFRLRDEITNGDHLEVLVDGESVPVYLEGSATPVGDEPTTRQGTYHFEIPARSLLARRSVEVRASDYTGLESRVESLRADGFHVTTLMREALAVAALVGFVVVVIAVAYRVRLVA